MSSFATLISNQRLFFHSNATKSVDFRIKQLKTLQKTLQTNEEVINKALFADFKKSDYETYTTELALVYGDINEAIKKLRKWSKPKKVRTNLVNFPAKSYIIPEPLGVALIIGTWNYPIQLTLAPLVAAMAAGCTVVLKPSEVASNTSGVLAQIIAQAFDENYIAVVEGDASATTALLEERFDKIFFTGSTHVGRIVYQAAAKNLTPVTLELGGKSPAIVTPSCSIEMTAKRLVWAKFLNAGQTCIAPDYVVVHEKVEKQLLAAVKKEIQKAHYSIENKNFVQIVSNKHVERLLHLMAPSTVYFGGEYNKEERFIEPTLLVDVDFSDKVMQEEIFGPILPFIAYTNLNEVIHTIKQLEKPLSCYVFTNDKHEKEKILNELSFGGGAVNDALMHISNSNLPFGGVGNSGMGAYHGKAGFDAFSHFKSIIDKPTWMELSIKYSPYSMKKLGLIKRLLG